ncbi:type VII secretion protein EccB [Gordonia sp. ABSL1-1]|uniref:type VII secretion protein EccB n=1 Tax=Gordonia sp. ABSL1-1 TaxID=3053923 RepID=UPI00257338FF|nr:type VII secretion protein EccB [Gordonia sp. ABSL1-1]MDL9935650.1 type VII secretion protein EccB [Gordonia sp. ABSL1-1]
MARQLTTKAQVNGYRFLLKRLEHALVRRDVRMLHDPMRTQLQALTVGLVLGLLLLAGCGIWGVVRPQGAVGDEKIVISKDGGGTYVLVDGTLHPVLNLASARLIVGSADSPKSVADKKLDGFPRGPLLGIPGAPGALHSSAQGHESSWTVCDSSSTTPGTPVESIELSVIGDHPRLDDRIGTAASTDAALVTSGGLTFLVYHVEGAGSPTPVRAQIDTDDVPVLRALGAEGVRPRQISTALLNSFPRVDDLRVPVIRDAGLPAAGLPGVRIGSVVKTTGLHDESHYHVVLADGVQPIGALTAEILRLADRGGTIPVITLSPGQVAAMPVAASLPVGAFPVRRPRLLDTGTAPVLCRSWTRGSRPAAVTTLLAGRSLPLPADARPVHMTSTDGAGPGVDRVYLRPGSGEYVQATGDESDSRRAESLFYVSDSGVRFGVPDIGTGTVLGLGDSPRAAPWSIIGLLAAGPTLSRPAALVSHDGLAPNPSAGVVADPSGR